MPKKKRERGKLENASSFCQVFVADVKLAMGRNPKHGKRGVAKSAIGNNWLYECSLCVPPQKIAEKLRKNCGGGGVFFFF